MTKRTFGVGALTMICACVSGSADPTSDAGVAEVVTAPPPLPAKDGSTTTDASLLFPDGSTADADADAQLSTCPANTPLTVADLDQDPGWKPAKAPSPECTANDITQFEKNFGDPNIKTWTGLGTNLTSSCSACLITADTETSWGPVVHYPSSAANKGFINFGACFGRVETEACGKAVQYSVVCLDRACDACTSTSSERIACNSKADAAGGMCNSFDMAMTQECPQLSTSAKKCNRIIDAAKTLCGPNAGDAGG
jgi:hypothetical protein